MRKHVYTEMHLRTNTYIHIYFLSAKGGIRIKTRYDSTFKIETIKKLNLFICNSDGEIKSKNTIIEYLVDIFLGFVTPDDVLNNRMPEFFTQVTPVIKDLQINEAQENFEINTNDFDLL